MSVRRRKPPSQEVDLEATAELPVIDFEATDTVAVAITAEVPELTDSLREVESRLQRKSERVRELEAQLASAGELAPRVAAAEQSLAEARSTLETRDRELAAARTALADQQRQLTELQRLGERQQQELRHQVSEMEELRQRSERQCEALRHTQGVRGVFEGLIAEREHALAHVESRHAADVAATAVRVTAQQEEFRQREAGLTARIAELETAAERTAAELSEMAQKFAAAEQHSAGLAGQIDAQRAQIASQEAELAQLRTTHATARTAAEVFEAQQARIRELENECAAAQQRSVQLDQDLRAAEDQIQRLECDARANALLLGNLQQDIARLGSDDTGARPGLKLVAPEQLPERFLVRLEAGMEVGHPLGRRTTIGRTSDNDIQIEATFVSRHHAVILGNGQHCIIEDLNSTNGVLVNGRRVNRQMLRDGDNVAIGKAVFRFQQPA
ncbi:MAG: FHA domain-containing protein [Steroidobacteraceae bacterium]